VRSKAFVTTSLLALLSVLAAACDEGDADRDADVLGASAERTAATRPAIPTITVPTIYVELPSGAATAIAEVPTTVARAIEQATSVAPAATATSAPAGTPSGITITFVEFDCDGYRFAVKSQPEALLRVHWTAVAPDEPDPVSSRSVSDNEVSQSPGEHTFEQSKDGWAKPGSNRLTIRGENVSGGTHEESRAISC
jgi:hypothetical protein